MKKFMKNKNGLSKQSVLFMVETVGIEPMTSCMSSMRSNQLSYASATDGIISHAEGFVKGFLKSFLRNFSCSKNRRTHRYARFAYGIKPSSW